MAIADSEWNTARLKKVTLIVEMSEVGEVVQIAPKIQ